MKYGLWTLIVTFSLISSGIQAEAPSASAILQDEFNLPTLTSIAERSPYIASIIKMAEKSKKFLAFPLADQGHYQPLLKFLNEMPEYTKYTTIIDIYPKLLSEQGDKTDALIKDLSMCGTPWSMTYYQRGKFVGLLAPGGKLLYIISGDIDTSRSTSAQRGKQLDAIQAHWTHRQELYFLAAYLKQQKNETYIIFQKLALGMKTNNPTAWKIDPKLLSQATFPPAIQSMVTKCSKENRYGIIWWAGLSFEQSDQKDLYNQRLALLKSKYPSFIVEMYSRDSDAFMGTMYLPSDLFNAKPDDFSCDSCAMIGPEGVVMLSSGSMITDSEGWDSLIYRATMAVREGDLVKAQQLTNLAWELLSASKRAPVINKSAQALLDRINKALAGG